MMIMIEEIASFASLESIAAPIIVKNKMDTVAISPDTYTKASAQYITQGLEAHTFTT